MKAETATPDKMHITTLKKIARFLALSAGKSAIATDPMKGVKRRAVIID